jgi:hypothetical protein
VLNWITGEPLVEQGVTRIKTVHDSIKFSIGDVKRVFIHPFTKDVNAGVPTSLTDGCKFQFCVHSTSCRCLVRNWWWIKWAVDFKSHLLAVAPLKVDGNPPSLTLRSNGSNHRYYSLFTPSSIRQCFLNVCLDLNVCSKYTA